MRHGSSPWAEGPRTEAVRLQAQLLPPSDPNVLCFPIAATAERTESWQLPPITARTRCGEITQSRTSISPAARGAGPFTMLRIRTEIAEGIGISPCAFEGRSTCGFGARRDDRGAEFEAFMYGRATGGARRQDVPERRSPRSAKPLAGTSPRRTRSYRVHPGLLPDSHRADECDVQGDAARFGNDQVHPAGPRIAI